MSLHLSNCLFISLTVSLSLSLSLYLTHCLFISLTVSLSLSLSLYLSHCLLISLTVSWSLTHTYAYRCQCWYIPHHYGPRWHGRWIRHIWSTVRTCAHTEISLFEKTYVFSFFFIFSQSIYVELFFFILLCFLSPILFVSLRHTLSHFLSVQVSYFVPVFTHQ